MTINKSVQTEETIAACDSYYWNGQTYDKSGVYTFTGTTAAGCDSVATLHLTINKSVQTEETIAACDSYTWNGQTYTTSGDYTFNGQTAAGCDSIVTLHLTINTPVNADVYETACGSYFWNDSLYTTSGDYVYTTLAASGCDSTVTLHLTINQATIGTPEDVTICYGETYTWNGNDYNATGEYEVILTNAVGCDSTAILRLTILPETKVETDEWQLCPGDLITPREWHGLSITTAGNYETSDKFVDTDCDSVIYKLTVTIPDADNDVTMDNLPAVSKYNNRVLLLNLNEIKDIFDGWAPAEENVQWFRVVGTQDAAYAAWNKLGDDEPLAKGHYYNLPDGGTLPAGQYYALVWRSSDVCEGGEIMCTVLITCGVDASGPRLVPNVVRANETLTLENLNPSDVNEIRVYSSTGQLVATYTAEQVGKFIFNAATVSGYYLVDVENKNNKVTLRYVVK